MHFYCYSKFGESSHRSSLGEPDYSYYFVLKAYVPLLEKLGTVEVIDSLEPEYLNTLSPAPGDSTDVYLFIFTPPHKIPDDLPGKVIPVFAWEYSNLPVAGRISDPQDCWRTKLLKCGQALTISNYAKNIVLEEINPQFSIESIPAPISPESMGMHEGGLTSQLALSPDITVIDSRNFVFNSSSVTPANLATHPFHRRGPVLDIGDSLEVDLGSVDSAAISVGFYPPEGWGAWSNTDGCWIVLPHDIEGRVRVSVAVRAHGRNIGQNITLALASESISLELKAEMVEHEFEISLSNCTNFICFQGIDHSASGSLNDTRCIGIGIAKIRITPVSPPKNSAIQNNAQLPPLSLDTPVYTSVFNPRDNRKNWEDIISAFCFAFRDKTEATLILKMTCGSLEDFLEDFFRLLCQLQPFKCRIIAIQGYLAAGDLQNLRDVTKFIVNASHGEGQCLPLVEFMAQGTPAIAPQHTALADYINEKCAFIVSSAPELTFWPHEPEQKLTTLWYRPDWESLRDAYTKSYDLLMLPQGDYTQMSLSAVESIRAYCSEDVLLETMQQFLAGVKDSEVRLS